MTKEELIKILEGYEVFVDDDYGGSYQSIIAYTKDKKISKAFTSLGALQIIDTFEKMQKEKQELIDYLKDLIENRFTNSKVVWFDSEYARDFGELCSMAGAGDTRLALVPLSEIENILSKIEIIEEDKDIEELKIENDNSTHFYIRDERGTKCGMTKHSKLIAEKLNEVIKEVNKLRKDRK